MTIHELLALTGLTESDEIPVWDEEASGEPTKKITAQNFAAAIKTLASLLGTSDVVNDLTSTATDKPLAAAQGKALNDKLANILKIETISNVVTDNNGMYISDYNMEKVVSAYIGTSTQLFILVRPSSNGKAVMYVYQYNGTTLVPKSNETVSINVWVKG